jgi:hypothetical protein
MNHDTFNKLVESRLATCKEILIKKDKEYSSDTDRLHNFVVAGRMLGCTPIKALNGMMIKHSVSVSDIFTKMEADPLYRPSKDLIDDKITDVINYLLLAEGLMEDRRAKVIQVAPAGDDLRKILSGKPEPSMKHIQKGITCCQDCGQYHGFHSPECGYTPKMEGDNVT